jgi:hypothetical protein
MRRATGYAQTVGESDRLTFIDQNGVRIEGGEADTYSCGHCNRVVHVPPFTDARSIGGGCFICDRHICPKCVDDGNCKPMEKRLEEIERRAMFERDFKEAIK